MFPRSNGTVWGGRRLDEFVYNADRTHEDILAYTFSETEGLSIRTGFFYANCLVLARLQIRYHFPWVFRGLNSSVFLVFAFIFPTSSAAHNTPEHQLASITIANPSFGGARSSFIGLFSES